MSATESAELDESPEPAATVEETTPSKPTGSRPSWASARRTPGDEAAPGGLRPARVVASVRSQVHRDRELAERIVTRPSELGLPVTTHSRSMASGRQNPSL